MAKGAAMGLWRGKKGSSVFYRIANSNNQQKQGIRERNYEPANPQTERQASQRLKMRAAQGVYGALKPIISRAWQGTKYGVMTRQAYLKLALKMKEGYPYLLKDETRPVPGTYVISYGSLPTVICEVEDITTIESNIATTVGQGQSITIGQKAADILDKNPWLQQGDQITAVICNCSAEDFGSDSLMDAQFTWDYESFYLNPDDSTPSDGLTMFDTINDKLGITCNNNRSLAAGTIIVSRVDDAGNHMRSTQALTVAEAVLEYYTGAVRRQEARRSYQRRVTQITDWQTEQTDQAQTVRDLYTISGVTGSKAAVNGQRCWVIVDEESGNQVACFTTSQGYLVAPDGTAVSIVVAMEETFITPADVPALAALPTVQYS